MSHPHMSTPKSKKSVSGKKLAANSFLNENIKIALKFTRSTFPKLLYCKPIVADFLFWPYPIPVSNH